LKKKGSNRTVCSEFSSRSEHCLDPKGRLNIPSRFRGVLQTRYSEKLVLTNWENCIKAYPLEVWKALIDTIKTKGATQVGFEDLLRYLVSGATDCTPDKQGRVLLPSSLRLLFKIEKEVVLNGMLDHFEIWDKQVWAEEVRKTRENFGDYKQGLSALGIL